MSTKSAAEAMADEERVKCEQAMLDAAIRRDMERDYWEDDYRYSSFYEEPTLEPSVTLDEEFVHVDDWNTPDTRWNPEFDDDEIERVDWFYADMIRRFDEDWKELQREEANYDPDGATIASLSPRLQRVALAPHRNLSSRLAVMYSEKRDRCTGWFGDDAKTHRVTFYACRSNGKNSKDVTLRTHRTGR